VLALRSRSMIYRKSPTHPVRYLLKVAAVGVGSVVGLACGGAEVVSSVPGSSSGVPAVAGSITMPSTPPSGLVTMPSTTMPSTPPPGEASSGQGGSGGSGASSGYYPVPSGSVAYPEPPPPDASSDTSSGSSGGPCDGFPCGSAPALPWDGGHDAAAFDASFPGNGSVGAPPDAGSD
jgi:hypothetical protein